MDTHGVAACYVKKTSHKCYCIIFPAIMTEITEEEKV